MAAIRTLHRWRRWSVWAAVIIAAVALTAGGAAWWQARQPAACYARALAAVDAKQLAVVETELRALQTVPEYEPQCHYLRGVLRLEAGQYYPALEEFGGCVEEPTLRVRTLVRSGQSLYSVRQFQEAIALLRQAVEAEPDCAEAHRWLAAAYYDLGLTVDAVRHLDRVAELVPTDARPHRLKGLINKDLENYQAAVEAYGESLRRDAHQPDGDAIRDELALCQVRLRRHEDALATLAECRPSPNRWSLEAECHHGCGRIAEAQQLVEQTLEAEPANLRALLLKGTIALEAGQAAAAVQVFSRAVQGYPKDYSARFKLERAYRRLPDPAQADEQARAVAELKQLREEFGKLHETAAVQPRNADVRCRLGVLARELDRPDLARVWFQAALAIDPQHAETLRQLNQRPATQ